jgi:hypothetical protein
MLIDILSRSAEYCPDTTARPFIKFSKTDLGVHQRLQRELSRSESQRGCQARKRSWSHDMGIGMLVRTCANDSGMRTSQGSSLIRSRATVPFSNAEHKSPQYRQLEGATMLLEFLEQPRESRVSKPSAESGDV